MNRLSIELTPEQHKRIKAIAALQGQTIKDYVLERVLAPIEQSLSDEDKALKELENFLKPRIAEAEEGNVLNQSVESIFAEVRDEIG